MDRNEAQGRRLLERQALPRDVVSAAWEIARSRTDMDLCAILQQQGHLNPVQAAAIRSETGTGSPQTGSFDPARIAGPQTGSPQTGSFDPSRIAGPQTGSPQTGSFDPSRIAGPAAATPAPGGLIQPIGPSQTASYESGQIPRATGSYESGQIPRATGSYDSGQIPRATGSYDSGQIPRAHPSGAIPGAAGPPPTGAYNPAMIVGHPGTGRYDPNALQSSFETGSTASSGGSAYVSGGMAAVGPSGHTSAMMNSNVSDTGGGRLITGGVSELIDRLTSEGLPNVEVTGELGRGGMGVVLEGKDRSLGIDVVVKVMLTADATPDALMRFQREARSLARVDHPGIVKVRELSEFEGYPYFVMERVDGEDLMVKYEAAIAETGQPPDLEMVIDAIASTARALDAAHQEQILHRDVKPANIILENGTGRAVLVDFGLAKAQSTEAKQALDDTMAELTKTADIIGTPAYMAPEQLDRGGDFGEQGACTDLWGIAATLYLLVCGETPYRGATMANIFKAVLTADPPRATTHRSEVPEWLDDLLATCLQRHGGKRPSLTTFAECLEARSLEPLGDTAPPPPPGRWKLPAAIAATVVVLIGLILGGLYVTRELPPPVFKIVATIDATVLSAEGKQLALVTTNAKVVFRIATRAEGFAALELAGDRVPLDKGVAKVELDARSDGESHQVIAIDWLGRSVATGISLTVTRDTSGPVVSWGPLPTSSLPECRLTGTVNEPCRRFEFGRHENAVTYDRETGHFTLVLKTPLKDDKAELYVEDLYGNVTKVPVPVRTIGGADATHTSFEGAVAANALCPLTRVFLRPNKPKKDPKPDEDKREAYVTKYALALEPGAAIDVEVIGESGPLGRPLIEKTVNNDTTVLFQQSGGRLTLRNLDIRFAAELDAGFAKRLAARQGSEAKRVAQFEQPIDPFSTIIHVPKGDLVVENSLIEVNSDIPDAVPILIGSAENPDGTSASIVIRDSTIKLGGTILHGVVGTRSQLRFERTIFDRGAQVDADNAVLTASLIYGRCGSLIVINDVTMANANASVFALESTLTVDKLAIDRSIYPPIKLRRSTGNLRRCKITGGLIGALSLDSRSRATIEDSTLNSVGTNVQGLSSCIESLDRSWLHLKRCKISGERGFLVNSMEGSTVVADNCELKLRDEGFALCTGRVKGVTGYLPRDKHGLPTIPSPLDDMREAFWNLTRVNPPMRRAAHITLRGCSLTGSGGLGFALMDNGRVRLEDSRITPDPKTPARSKLLVLADQGDVYLRGSTVEGEFKEDSRNRPSLRSARKIRGKVTQVARPGIDPERLKAPPETPVLRMKANASAQDWSSAIARLDRDHPTRVPRRIELEPGRHRLHRYRSTGAVEIVGLGKPDEVVVDSDQPCAVALRGSAFLRLKSLTLTSSAADPSDMKEGTIPLIALAECGGLELEDCVVASDDRQLVQVLAAPVSGYLPADFEGFKTRGGMRPMDAFPILRMTNCILRCRGKVISSVVVRACLEMQGGRIEVQGASNPTPLFEVSRHGRLSLRGVQLKPGRRSLASLSRSQLWLKDVDLTAFTTRPALSLARSTATLTRTHSSEDDKLLKLDKTSLLRRLRPSKKPGDSKPGESKTGDSKPGGSKPGRGD